MSPRPYFQGRPVLYGDTRKALVEVCQSFEMVLRFQIGLSEEAVGTGAEGAPDGPERREEHTPAQEAAYIVDLAKVEALEAMGERRAAIGIVDRRLTCP